MKSYLGAKTLRGLTLLTIAGLLLAGCSPAAPAAPTAAAKPTEAAKPAASAAPAAPAAPAASPAAAGPAQPAASPAAPAASPAAPVPVASPAAVAPSGPAKPVNVAVGGNLIASPWYVGVDKGIFLKHGLDVKIRSFPQGSDSMKAIAAHEVDFAHTVNSTLLSAIEGGLPIVVLASAVGDATRNFADDAFTLIGGPKVKTVQDLAGKKVGMVNQGTSPPFLRAILAKNGMTYDQVEIVNVPQANHARTLAAGQIDAVVTAEPYGVMALDMTPDATLLVRGGGYVSFAGEVFTRPDVVQNDPDTVQKLVDGFSEAAFVTRQNTDEVAEIVSHWMTGLDPGVAKRAIKYMYYDPRFSQLSLEGLQADMKALVDAKTLKGPIDLPKYMNLSYLDKTLQKYPEYFSDLKPAPPAKL